MLFLNIDTAIDKGSFCISRNNEVITFEMTESRNEQAGWLHEAIQHSFKQNNLDFRELDAVAVSNGPGSYTGLRIGLSTAKGLCYALNKPLICINTLQIIAAAVELEAKRYICPMIDARRMEVFTALFDKNLTLIKEPFATILNEKSFSDTLKEDHIVFTGNGSKKFRSLINDNVNAEIVEHNIDARNMISLSAQYYQEKNFADVAYCEPYYVKDVYISKKEI
ncbi:tRNA (adenosine(37)-N6)-threonylcarbamoyltransferase complex dimerization subunit type 1 TsaB [Niabella yanshanensis]|uniref:tRNA (Adenosine(37)-N6)-threonylcarbamoyltransferase complex dimerization subunit type 1 TsaB n=1 Tax=Niabella yanshanensis TaxID=577386 RepID=A0ABZ0VZ64_9BACT|nr:tRNA (adenosine(37)-N6)-threonylcarbamoyltransferase complex dimerization subunit type 1 TsaB [Niabella yanshanensis]WQD36318.1 tRNA (adenosine(37)-N6)-threonylcarbamoyltransferase complex dimerization subunit type 1 TsaB [Niabella yanshanensis]